MPLVDVRMPAEEQEGTEAALGRWLKQPGDAVAEAEPLLEISTDKVTLEVPAPASGVLRSVAKQPGDAVHPGEFLGAIDASSTGEAQNSAVQQSDDKGHAAVSAVQTLRASAEFTATPQDSFSPAVRRLLSELGLDPREIAKVSRGGRLTPEDIKAHLLGGGGAAGTEPRPASHARTGTLVPHTPMRRAIARHMVESMHAAPHVTAVFEADMSHVLAHRERLKADAPGEAVPSITAYLIYTAVKAIKTVPEVNSRWHEDGLEVFDHVHFGIGTALEGGGLVVPVIRNAEQMSLAELAVSLRHILAKARSGKLSREDMDGGTFTLSNHGVSGSLLAAPIILPEGQAAILGAGKVQKRVIVCETAGRELFRVRPMAYVTLTVDHRALDAQQANAFLGAFVAALEHPQD